MGGVEYIKEVFHFVLAALARIKEQQRKRQQGIYLHTHDRRTQQYHHKNPHAQRQCMHPRAVNALERVGSVFGGVKQGGEHGEHTAPAVMNFTMLLCGEDTDLMDLI